MEFDGDLLASIASGGLGHWIEQEDGSMRYLKDEDCVGACGGGLEDRLRAHY